MGAPPSVAPASSATPLAGEIRPAGCAEPAPSASGQPEPGVAIDLGAALRLAGVENPTINLAREQVQEALAGQLAASSLLIPNLNVGGNYRMHGGALLSSAGILRIPSTQSLYVGAGAGAIGAGTIAVPGVWLFTHLGDALYEPLAARQRVAARESDAAAVRNAVLLDVVTAYLELAGAEARRDVLRQAEADVGEIVRVTAVFAKTGEGTAADANRAGANAELIRGRQREADGAIAAASAQLSRLLALNPSPPLHTPGGPIEAFRLVNENDDLESLVRAALQFRPEVFARSAAILEAQTQARQERARPWLPLLAVGYSAGFFGGGSDQSADDFRPLKGRSDFAVMAVWNGQNLGFGNHTRARRAEAVVGQRVASYEAAVNQIRREVAEAQADAQTAARQLDLAKSALAAAEEGYRLEAERIRQGQGRPIEALDSFRQLFDTRLEVVRAVIAFDAAQFRLFVALGNNPVCSSPRAASRGASHQQPHGTQPVGLPGAPPPHDGSGGSASTLFGTTSE